VTTYYPSGLLNLLVRLDDGYEPLSPEAVATLQGGTAPYTAGTAIEALAPSNDGLSLFLAIPPNELTHERNGPRTADTLSVRIAYRDLPVPPRAIRSIGVVWHADTVTPENYALGMREGLAGRSTAPAILAPTTANKRFVGFVDTVEEDDGACSLNIEARDFTALLIDQIVPPSVLATTATDVRLDALVMTLLRSIPGNVAKGLTVEFVAWGADDEQGPPDPFPVVSDVYGKQGRARRGKSPRLSASSGGADVSYWDVLTDICVACGYLPVIEEDRLRIIPPRTLYEGEGSFRRAVATASGVEQLTARRFIVGLNAEDPTFRRSFARLSIPSIIVRSTVPGLREPLTSRWPPEAKTKARPPSVTPSGRGAQDRSELVLVRGISTQAQLDRIARNLWHEYALGEYVGKIATTHLASYGGGNADPDILGIRSGDPVDVVRRGAGAAGGVLSTIADLQSLEARFEALRASGVSGTAARSIVQFQAATSGLGSTFRVKSMSQAWRFSDTPSVRTTLNLGSYMTVQAPGRIVPGATTRFIA